MRERAAGHNRGNWAEGERSGFTLIELLVVIVIVMILAGGAVPNILGSIQRGRVQTAALQLAQDLRLVREGAVLYQADLYFYVSTDTAVNTSYWYEQLPKLNSSGVPDGSHYDPSIGVSSRFVQTSLPFNMHVVSISFSPPATPTSYGGHAYYFIDFRSGKDGSIPGSVAALTTVVVGDSAGRTWRVMVDAVGRPRVTQVTP